MIGRRQDTCSGSACLAKNVSYDCISCVWDLCTYAGSASGLEPVLYAIRSYYRLSDIDFSPSIVLADCVVEMKSGNTLYIRACDDEDSRLRRAQPKPQNAACLIPSVSHI